VTGFLIIILLLGAFWFVAVLPRRRRMQQHHAMQDSLSVGDDVVTAGGLHGRVDELEDGQVRLEVAEGVVVTVDRRAIAAVATEIEVEPNVEPEADFGSTNEGISAPEPEEPEEPS
jgi:preprotein translocase subunit YajC